MSENRQQVRVYFDTINIPRGSWPIAALQKELAKALEGAERQGLAPDSVHLVLDVDVDRDDCVCSAAFDVYVERPETDKEMAARALREASTLAALQQAAAENKERRRQQYEQLKAEFEP